MKNAPFMNLVLQSILHEGLFKGWTGLYKLFPEEFREQSGEREVPAVLIALAATYVSYVSVWCVSGFFTSALSYIWPLIPESTALELLHGMITA